MSAPLDPVGAEVLSVPILDPLVVLGSMIGSGTAVELSVAGFVDAGSVVVSSGGMDAAVSVRSGVSVPDGWVEGAAADVVGCADDVAVWGAVAEAVAEPVVEGVAEGVVEAVVDDVCESVCGGARFRLSAGAGAAADDVAVAVEDGSMAAGIVPG